MNHLIILANPKKESFSASIAAQIKNSAESLGNNVVIRDLYKIGFNPVLSEADMLAYAKSEYPEDVATEHEHIKWADVISFVFPIWWQSPPAMLKGYFDRIFSNGFAFRDRPDGSSEPLLNGKKALLFSTLGAGIDIYEKFGLKNAIKLLFADGTMGFCGITPLDYKFFGSVHKKTDEDIALIMQEVAATIKQHCA